MLSIKQILVSLLFTSTNLLLLSCGGSDSAPTSPNIPTVPEVFLGGTNRGIITGDQIGDGTQLNQNIVKVVPVTSSIDGFSIGPAYLSRSGLNSFYWIIPVRNLIDPLCGIKFAGINFRDQNNIILSSKNFSFITGSVAKDVFANFCLAYNEKGYLLGINVSISANNVANISIDIVSEGTVVSGMPIEIWKPLTYSTISPNSFMATIQNMSAVAADTSRSSQYVLLDNDGKPLYWGFFNNITPETAPGDTSTLIVNTYIFDGAATQMEVFISP